MNRVYVIQEVTTLASGEVSVYAEVFKTKETQEERMEENAEGHINEGYEYRITKDGHHLFEDSHGNKTRYVLSENEVK